MSETRRYVYARRWRNPQQALAARVELECTRTLRIQIGDGLIQLLIFLRAIDEDPRDPYNKQTVMRSSAVARGRCRVTGCASSSARLGMSASISQWLGRPQR